MLIIKDAEFRRCALHSEDIVYIEKDDTEIKRKKNIKRI
jgi:hypothetical protein